jgi:hypothetical protein
MSFKSEWVNILYIQGNVFQQKKPRHNFSKRYTFFVANIRHFWKGSDSSDDNNNNKKMNIPKSFRMEMSKRESISVMLEW